MKIQVKTLISKILSITLLFTFTSTIVSKASEISTEIKPEIINTYEENDGTLITEFDDGAIVKADPNGDDFNILVPAYQGEENQGILNQSGAAVQSRAWFAIAKVVITYALNIWGACDIIQYITSGFNPCKIAIDYLVSSKPTGNFMVKGNYIAGYRPGCQPMHSSSCFGYYEYQVSRS